MPIPWVEVGLVLVLVVVNAAFAGSEVALISLREGQLRRLEHEGGRGRLVAQLARDPNQFLSTIQIGITLAGFLASAAAAVSLAQPLVPLLEGLGRAAEPVAVLLVTMVLTYLTLVVGELAPKRIALQRPERWARRAARPLALVSTLTRPAVWLLSKSTDLLVRLAGADPGRQREEVTEEEVRDMIVTGAVFRPEQRRILAETIELGERRLSDVLVPRRDVVAIPAEAMVQEAIRTLLKSTHGRAPVYRGDLDNVLGLVTLQDLVGAEGLVADCVRPIPALPEAMGVLDALRRLQAARGQLAIVVDEYGGTAGIITVEDLLEELVGEIYDEFDPDFRGVQHWPDGSMALPGSFPVHDLSDLGVSLPEGSYATVAGLILERLGRIPSEGDAVEVDRWRLEVLAMDRNAIGRVRLAPLGDDSRPGSGGPEGDRAAGGRAEQGGDGGPAAGRGRGGGGVAGGAARDADPQGAGEGAELDRRVEDQGLAVDADLHRLAGLELEAGAGPLDPARRAPAPAGGLGLEQAGDLARGPEGGGDDAEVAGV